jgi:eukaryotic-like serine/threonine-protein kinase
MDTALSPPVGLLLGGRYHVGQPIARGGMATVYFGTDTRLDRVVALKIAHPELSDDAEFVRRFIGEARSAARLSSPNVVGIFDQGSDKRLHYIAMEYVPGRTLRQLLDEHGRLSPREALDIMAGVLTGLDAAHSAGLAHRDVKPENVLMTASGAVKVADFGLARAVSGAVQTKGGMIIGTAAYLAPEQVSGGVSDARTDVYAAGIMLFELLTGAQPHTGDTPLDVAYKHVNESVPAPSAVLPGLHGSLDARVAMATSRDPDLRPADAGQFLRAVAEVGDRYPLSGSAQVPAPYDYSGPVSYSGPISYSGPVTADERWDSHPYQFGGSAPSPPPTEPRHGAVGASALPSLRPQHSLAPRSDAVEQPGDLTDMNHTLVVAEPTPFGEHPGQGGYYDGSFGGRFGHRAGRGSLSGVRQGRLGSSRQLFIVSGGLAAALVIALVVWWITSGRYETVPQLRMTAKTTAAHELRNLGLTAKFGTPVHSLIPAGEVIRTTPASGSRIASGSTVTLIVSLGPVLIQVPNVSGLPLAQAQAGLRAVHLRPSPTVRRAASSTVLPGDVISTVPRAYTKCPKSRPVILVVSAGPPLPNFVGMQVSDAENAAASGGYTINPVQNAKGSLPANTITRQSPPPNTPITPGEVVIVYYSPGPPLVAVPNVQGMQLAQAIQTLEHAGLQVSVTHEGPGNTVGNYDPTTPQPKGSVITVYVGFFSGL